MTKMAAHLAQFVILGPVIMTEVVLAFRLHISLHEDPNGQQKLLSLPVP